MAAATARGRSASQLGAICKGMVTLTGRETDWEIVYFKLYKSQIPVIEQALETAALVSKLPLADFWDAPIFQTSPDENSKDLPPNSEFVSQCKLHDTRLGQENCVSAEIVWCLCERSEQ